MIYSSGWLPGRAGAGDVCAQPRHVGGESLARTWFAGGASHFAFVTPFAKFDVLVEAFFWERGAVRPVVQTIVHAGDEFFVLSFKVSVLCSIQALVFFMPRPSWSRTMLLGRLELFTLIAVFSPGF